MQPNIREIKPDEIPLLTEFLYQAIYIPEGVSKPSRDILQMPELQIYIANFGEEKADTCLVAEVEGKIVGMAWARIIKDYGHLDDDTPSLSVSLLPDYRGKGIGTLLVRALLNQLKTHGYQRVSLSVQKANYAAAWYLKLGFSVEKENETEYVMVCRL